MKKEIVVASGKGGTGKTFVASNLLYFLASREFSAGGVDADVEAPDLLLALGGPREFLWREAFEGAGMVSVDYGKCIKCWRCIEACRFGALSRGPEGPLVDEAACEGLGTCTVVCPTGAISLSPRKIGDLYAARSEYGVLVVSGELALGGKNSGLLVYELKQRARREGVDYLVVDAAPGIGCPVISSLAGADVLIAVVEPTPQSAKGASRLLRVAESLGVEPLLLLNKYDLSEEYAKRVQRELELEILGSVRYDEIAVEAYTSMSPLIAYRPDSPASEDLADAFERLVEGWL